MKTSFFSITFLVTVIIANGQSWTKTEVEIRKFEQTVVTSILNSDTTSPNKVWAPEFLVNNPINNISVNRDTVLQIRKLGMID